MFNFKLVDKMGNIVANTFADNEKKAWDELIEKFSEIST